MSLVCADNTTVWCRRSSSRFSDVMTELHDIRLPGCHATVEKLHGVRFRPTGDRGHAPGFRGMQSMDNEALVRRGIDAIWNRGELVVADELFGPDYVNHDGLIPDLVHGPEAIKISVALYRVAFPDFLHHCRGAEQ